MLLLLLTSAGLAGIPKCRDLAGVVVSDAPVSPAPVERVGLLRSALWLGLRTYQVVISPADGAGCSMYPSCSRYAMAAVADEGPVRGTWLAAARVLHDHNDFADPVCLIGRRSFRYHPHTEDTWWR